MENGFSKECITNSLILLMETKKYENITIDDISARSGMSRRTIYRYFSNKQKIFDAYVQSIIDEYMTFVKNQIYQGEDIVKKSFEFAAEHYNFFKIAYQNNMPTGMLEILGNVVSQVVKYSKTGYFANQTPEYVEYYVAFVSSACWGLLCCYIKEGRQIIPDQTYNHYKKIVGDLSKRLS